MVNKRLAKLALIFLVLTLFSINATAKKPAQISVSSTDVGAYRYSELAAQAQAISKQFGTKVRAMPLGNGVARAIALRNGMVEFWQSCSAYYTAFEGEGDFADLSWGPQTIRILLLANREANFSPATQLDNSIKKLSDILGKRVAWVVGNSGINMQMKAYLAAGGIKLDEVKLVKFPGYSESVSALISNQVDVALAAKTSPVSMKVASSPSGLRWIEVPHENYEAWKTIQKIASFVSPTTVTDGAGVEEGQSLELGGYPCPVYVTYENQNDEIVYWFTKMLVESWKTYRNAIPKSAPYWKIQTAIKSHFAVPYHEGAIRYFKQIDVWTPALQEHQDELIKRETILQNTFKHAQNTFNGDEDEFGEYWLEMKENALNQEIKQ